MTFQHVHALRSPPKKSGRKPKPYTTSWGETIPGLSKCSDGRWRVIGSETAGKDIKFTESNEHFAVARFRQMTGQGVTSTTVSVTTSHASADEAMEAAFAFAKQEMAAGAEFDSVGRPLTYATPTLSDDPETGRKLLGYKLDPSIIWPWVAEQIRKRPKWVAERTGIEQIAYLTDLKPPTISPTLADVGKLYHEKSGIDPHWRKKSENFWDEFLDVVGGGRTTLRDLTQELVAEYKAEVLEEPPSPTYVKHRFGQIKTVIAYSKAWGKWSEDRAKALAFCSILIPPSTITLDPSPIDRSDYRKLLDAAAASTNRLSIMYSVLLLAMNACLYGSEVTDVQWSDLNLDAGTLVMDRGKTKVARVAMLWPRTVEGLKSLKRIDGIASPFLTEATRQAHNANTITKYYRALRTAAGVSDKVRFAHVRDGSYTAACEGKGVQYEVARILAGHRTGMSDHYVKRRPSIVAEACQAIEQAYFGSATDTTEGRLG